MRDSFDQRLDRAREACFVGRDRELSICMSALRGEIPRRVLHVQGPGGIGKTELLRAFARRAKRAGCWIQWTDGSAIEADPSMLDTLFGRRPPVRGEPSLYIIDGFERIIALEDRLRRVLLPRLPFTCCVAIGSRLRPSEAWRADPGWSELVEVLKLEPFSPKETGEYLIARGAAGASSEAAWREMHSATGGHPLSLALVSERDAGDHSFPPSLTDRGDLIHHLVERFTADAPSAMHRRALVALSIARHLSPELLERMLDLPDASETFSWLARLSFVSRAAAGLVLHDLVRSIVLVHAREHTPRRHARLLARALSYYGELARPLAFWSSPERFADAVHVLLQSIAPQFPPTVLQDHFLGGARDEDLPAIESMLLRHEGQEALEIFRFWQARGVAECLRVWTESEPCVGFLCYLRVDEIAHEDRTKDPGVAALCRYLEQEGVFDHGGSVLCARFWMAEATYQAPSPMQTWAWADIGTRFVTYPNLAFICNSAADVNYWRPALLAPSNPDVLEGADFELGGRRHGFIGKDGRHLDQRQNFANIFGELAELITPKVEAPGSSQALDRESFTRALRDAWRVIDRPDLLKESPLLQTSLAPHEGSSLDRARSLADGLRRQAERFLESPKDERYYLVLEKAFLKPAPKQRAAAAELGMGYSTFRRHIKNALERMAAWLWEEERSQGQPPGAASRS